MTAVKHAVDEDVHHPEHDLRYCECCEVKIFYWELGNTYHQLLPPDNVSNQEEIAWLLFVRESPNDAP